MRIYWNLLDSGMRKFIITHVGVSILSMNKRRMNEVITNAEDNNIEIHHQDTNSMSIDKCGV